MTTKVAKITKNKFRFNPCGNYVIVKPDVIEKISGGGIILNDDMVNAENTAKVRGIVVAIGKDAWKDCGDGKPWASVGSHVYFKRHVSDKIEDESDLDEHGKPNLYFLLTDLDILATIEE